MGFFKKLIKGVAKVAGTAVKVGTGLVAKIAPAIIGNLPIPGAKFLSGLAGKVLPLASGLTDKLVNKVTAGKSAAQAAALAPAVQNVRQRRRRRYSVAVAGWTIQLHPRTHRQGQHQTHPLST